MDRLGWVLRKRPSATPEPAATTATVPPATDGRRPPFGMCVYPGFPAPREPWFGGPTPAPDRIEVEHQDWPTS